MIAVVFSAKKKGESRYEETISDRPAAGGATIPATGPRAKPQPTDDFSHDRGRRPVARRSRAPDARSRVGVDEPGDGGRGASPGGGATRAASGAAGAPLGERSRLLINVAVNSCDHKRMRANAYKCRHGLGTGSFDLKR